MQTCRLEEKEIVNITGTYESENGREEEKNSIRRMRHTNRRESFDG